MYVCTCHIYVHAYRKVNYSICTHLLFTFCTGSVIDDCQPERYTCLSEVNYILHVSPNVALTSCIVPHL